MKRYIIYLLLFLLNVPCLMAQKKEIAQARTYIKSGKNLDKAEQAMTKLLADSANHDNLKVWLTLCDALQAQYEEQNEKMYLRQKVDTATAFQTLRRLFVACEAMDSAEVRATTAGGKQPHYRERHAAYLNTYRANLRSGAAYFLHHQNYAESFAFNSLYIDSKDQPLFSAYHYADSPLAAYWALFAGYKLQQPELTLRYADMALRDSTHLEYTLQYLAETYQALGDMARYEQALTEGFHLDGESPFFFTNLMDYYNQRDRADLAMRVVDEALEKNDSSELFLFAKSTQLLNMGQYEASISVCDTLIGRHPALADAYYNAGVAWLNLAFELEKDSGLRPAEKRKRLKDYYQKAKPYIETYRELCPEEREKWAAALYNIYLNLNMGREFQEIDRLLRE